MSVFLHVSKLLFYYEYFRWKFVLYFLQLFENCELSYCGSMVARFSVTNYLIVSITSAWRKIWFSLRVSRTHTHAHTPVPSLVTEPFSSLPGYIWRKSSHDRDHPREMKHGYMYFDKSEGISLFHRRNRWRVDPKNVPRCQDTKNPWNSKSPPKGRSNINRRWIGYFFFFFPSGCVQAYILLSRGRVLDGRCVRAIVKAFQRKQSVENFTLETLFNGR